MLPSILSSTSVASFFLLFIIFYGSICTCCLVCVRYKRGKKNTGKSTDVPLLVLRKDVRPGVGESFLGNGVRSFRRRSRSIHSLVSSTLEGPVSLRFIPFHTQGLRAGHAFSLSPSHLVFSWCWCSTVLALCLLLCVWKSDSPAQILIILPSSRTLTLTHSHFLHSFSPYYPFFHLLSIPFHLFHQFLCILSLSFHPFFSSAFFPFTTSVS